MPMLVEEREIILATCGESGPCASAVSPHFHEECLYLFIPNVSEHLFNLQCHTGVVLLSPQWELHGRGEIETESAAIPPAPWQVIVRVHPTCLHILSKQGAYYAETIDFGE